MVGPTGRPRDPGLRARSTGQRHAPTWTRTRGLLLRRESLYPPELSGPRAPGYALSGGSERGPAMLGGVAKGGETAHRRGGPSLLSPTVARVATFVPFACLGVLEWGRLSAHGSAAESLAWVAGGGAAMLAVVATDRLIRRPPSLALNAVTAEAFSTTFLYAGSD